MKFSYLLIFNVIFSLSFFGCTKTSEEQVQEYMEFYFPTSGEFTYNIVFDWGEYEIITGAKMNEELHPDSEPFKGFITFRPFLNKNVQDQLYSAYVITPEGEVWQTTRFDSIPETNTRKEVIEKKTDYGTSTQTRTIVSASEPLITSFQNNKHLWEKYGKLTIDGEKSTFTRYE